MKTHLILGISVCIIIFAVVFFLPTGCEESEMKVTTKPLQHASEELLIRGRSKAAVKKHFGEPSEIKDSDFRKPAYGVPEQLPSCDEQWIYVDAEAMTNTLVYFNKGKVILAIREWSDY